jgi:hypothetical protein
MEISSATRLRCPLSSVTRLRCPLSSATRLKCPLSSATRLRCPLSSATRLKCPLSSATRLRCPLSSVTCLRCPLLLHLEYNNVHPLRGVRHEGLAESGLKVLSYYGVPFTLKHSAMIPVALVGPLAIKWCKSCLSIRDKMDREPPS